MISTSKPRNYGYRAQFPLLSGVRKLARRACTDIMDITRELTGNTQTCLQTHKHYRLQCSALTIPDKHARLH